MLTPQLVKQALDTSFDACEGERNNNHICIHAHSVMANFREISEKLSGILSADERQPAFMLGKPFAVFYAGLHLGYRMHELEVEQEKTTEPLHVPTTDPPYTANTPLPTEIRDVEKPEEYRDLDSSCGE